MRIVQYMQVYGRDKKDVSRVVSVEVAKLNFEEAVILRPRHVLKTILRQ